MHAYVYLQVAPGVVAQTLASLDGRPGVRRAVAVTGEWDIIVALSEHPDIAAIGRTVFEAIQSLEGVHRTLTAPVAPLEATRAWRPPGRPRPFPMHRASPFCYVHVSLMGGSVVETLLEIADLPGVSGVAPLVGEWDALVELDAETLEDAVAIVVDAIGALEGVASTSTAVAVASTPDAEPPEQSG